MTQDFGERMTSIIHLLKMTVKSVRNVAEQARQSMTVVMTFVAVKTLSQFRAKNARATARSQDVSEGKGFLMRRPTMNISAGKIEKQRRNYE